MDTPWWQQYDREVSRAFNGLRVRGAGSSQSRLADRAMFGAGCLNSGAGALLMAAHYGARVIVMVGYDCSAGKDGAKHWHPDHPKGLGNAGMLDKWPAQFSQVAAKLNGKVRIINASRRTALECFERLSLYKALRLS
jgi:hypothetical protein